MTLDVETFTIVADHEVGMGGLWVVRAWYPRIRREESSRKGDLDSLVDGDCVDRRGYGRREKMVGGRGSVDVEAG